jgi:hypothetical protein
MRRLGGSSRFLGPAGVALAIVVGATLPVVLSAAGSAATPGASSTTGAAACASAHTTGATPPVAVFSPPCPPALTANPSAGLADGQTITVTGANFTPNATIGMAECLPSALDPSNCDLSNVNTAQSDGTGAFSTTFNVGRIIHVGTTNNDCALSPCILGAADISNYAVAAAAALEFNPNIPPLLTGTLAPTDMVNTRTGVAYIAGTVTCTRPLIVDLYVDLQQIYHRRFNFENYAYRTITCNGKKKGNKWVVAVPPGLGLFGAGKATVQAQLSTYGQPYRNVGISGRVLLQPKQP